MDPLLERLSEPSFTRVADGYDPDEVDALLSAAAEARAEQIEREAGAAREELVALKAHRDRLIEELDGLAASRDRVTAELEGLASILDAHRHQLRVTADQINAWLGEPADVEVDDDAVVPGWPDAPWGAPDLTMLNLPAETSS